MTKRRGSKPLTMLIKEPWVGRGGMLSDWGYQAKEKWLKLKKGSVVADADRLSFAFSLIERMKEVNPYLRVAVVVPSPALQELWFEEVHRFFDFPEGIVGLINDKHQDYFSKMVRILICTTVAANL